MKNKDSNPKQQTQVLEGFNPNIYRQLSFVFIMLTILNLAVIIYAFWRTGYGLWHAEDALAYIAKIDASFEDINQDILKIQLHSDDQQVISECVGGIFNYQQKIQTNASSFREINLSNIDATIPEAFERSMRKFDVYYSVISENLSAVQDGSAAPDVLITEETEQLREDAAQSFSKLFEDSDEATYQFFCRVGQRFLFVLLFLILTMATGIYAIHRSKKKDYEVALKLQNSKQKTATIRRKAEEIAYVNIVTGLKNRYALDETLDERMKDEDVSVSLYNFNGFKSLNEHYGRDFADEFVAEISQQVASYLGEQGEIFSTNIDELCILFRKDLPKSRANNISNRITELLSQPIEIREVTVQLSVAGCICHSKAKTLSSSSELFRKLDRGMAQAKATCMEQNRSILVPCQ